MVKHQTRQKQSITPDIPHIEARMTLLKKQRTRIKKKIINDYNDSLSPDELLTIRKQLWSTYYPDAEDMAQSVIETLGVLTLKKQYSESRLDKHKNQAWNLLGEIIGENFKFRVR